jgi:PST family polysaccharide transporter
MSLASKAASGGLVMMAGQIAKVILQFVNLIVLARILTPETFGLVAMVLAIYGVGEIIRDCGLSIAAIQAKHLSQTQASNLFWANFTLGGILTVLTYFFAHFISEFYDRSELIEIAQGLSLLFFINGLSAQFKAQLNRDLKFKRLVVVELVGFSMSIAVGIYLAYAGYSYMAIVYQQIVQALIFLILYVSFGRWIPGMPKSDGSTKELFSFGWNLMGAQIIGYISHNIPAVLIGYKYGAVQLGFFERALKFLMLPLNQLSAPSQAVAVPMLSRLNLTDNDKYNQFLLFGQNVILHLVTFALALVVTQTERLIIVILGEEWIGMVTIFQALSIGGVFLVLGYSSYWVFLSKGITSELLKLNLVARPLLILITSLGLLFGPTYVALFYSFGLGLTWLIGLYWLKDSGIPTKKMIINPIVVASVYFISAYLSYQLIGTQNLQNIEGILAGWSLFTILLVIAYFGVPIFKSSVNQLFAIRHYIGRKNETV